MQATKPQTYEPSDPKEADFKTFFCVSLWLKP